MWLSDFGKSKAGREPQRGPGTIFWGNHRWSQTWMEWGIERQKSLEEDHVRLRRCPWKGWEATDIRRDRIMHVWMCQEPAGITRRKESTGSVCPGRVTAAITRPPPLPVPSRLSGVACAAHNTHVKQGDGASFPRKLHTWIQKGYAAWQNSRCYLGKSGLIQTQTCEAQAGALWEQLLSLGF